MRRRIAFAAILCCLAAVGFYWQADEDYDPLDYPTNQFLIREIETGEPIGPLPFPISSDQASVCLEGDLAEYSPPMKRSLDDHGKAIYEDNGRLVELSVVPAPETIIRQWQEGKLPGIQCTIG